MKKISTLWLVVLLSVFSVCLTSCDDDDDDDIAYTLEGTWRGNMYISEDYGGRTYDASYSELCFSQDPYTYSSGTGYWIDYYSSNAPWQYVANHIQWTVQDRVIYVHFVEEPETNITIYDYSLDDGYFEGYIDSNAGSHVHFQLTHIDSPHWSDYYYGDDWDDYYYAKPNGVTRGSEVTVEKPKRIIREK